MAPDVAALEQNRTDAVDVNGHIPALHAGKPKAASIIDIRRSHDEASLADEIKRGLKPQDGSQKTLPTLLLYDEAGLKLFEDVTYLDEYYLTNAEIEVLEQHAESIASFVKPGSMIVELGSGNLRKVNILLQALERQGKRIDYYALDCSLTELERTLAQLPTHTYNHVKCSGLFGTYDDGQVWLQSPEVANRPKIVLSLGSSIGNFSRDDAGAWVKQFADILKADDAMLIGIDSCKDPKKVYQAYNDRHGVSHRFSMNGLSHANDILGEKVFDMNTWKATGKYDQEGGRHQAFVSPTKNVTVLGATIAAGEEIRIEESYKYSNAETSRLWEYAGVFETSSWTNSKGDYGMHLIAKKQYALPWDPEQYATGPVPIWQEWQELWKLWDTVTREMIPHEELMQKPIKLRNACIFYLGHIPTFFDMKLTDTHFGKYTEPSYFPKIFERGIDPDVDDPEKCHAHSEVPDDWPPLEEILAHQSRVRERVKSLYDDGKAEDPKIGRCLWLGYEHEAMHLETLLYMLIQSEKTCAPPGVAEPVFSVLAEQAESDVVPNEWFKIPEQDVRINMDDAETTEGPKRYFGWDAEKPSRKAHVKSFQAKARPITNGEYAEYMLKSGKQTLPASWTDSKQANGHTNGVNGFATTNGSSAHFGIPAGFLDGKVVRTVHGPVKLADALTWPVSASYDELAGCAAYVGGRIPTLEEARAIYAYADQIGGQPATQANARTIPAVNSHLVNNGVQESPPSAAINQNGYAGNLNPHDLFYDLKAKNVGFQLWHPQTVTDKGQQLQGQAGMGGLWEWTSSAMTRHEGFEPMPLYPAYSQDFHDGKHNIVLGGSWATVPRIAGRKSFINWYQRNYPYVWAGARLVRDV